MAPFRTKKNFAVSHGPGPVSLGELLRGSEYHEALRQPGPEHEVDVPRLPHPGLLAFRERPQEGRSAERPEQPPGEREAPHRELARPLDEVRAGGGRDAHRLPPTPFASACS